jgi:hypothetical protein
MSPVCSPHTMEQATPATASDSLLRELRDAASRADWDAVTQIVTCLPGVESTDNLSLDATNLPRLLKGLNEALLLAKTARTDMCATAARLNAISTFQDTLSDA